MEHVASLKKDGIFVTEYVLSDTSCNATCFRNLVPNAKDALASVNMYITNGVMHGSNAKSPVNALQT